MKSFEAGPSPEQIKSEEEITPELPKEEMLEMREAVVEKAELKPEQAIAQERSVLERFKGKAKQVAGVMMLMTALSAAPGFTQEVYAQEKGRQPVATEQVKEKQESSEEFSIKEGDHEFKLKFSGADVKKILDEQNIRFNEREGSFALFNEKQPGGILSLEFKEVDGVRTNMVEVEIDEIKLPNGITKKNLKIKVHNSDGSTENITLSDGKISNYSKEKPKE